MNRTPEDVDAWMPCYTCGRPIEWHGGMPPGPNGYWSHVDASEGFDCADRRGDEPLRPELEPLPGPDRGPRILGMMNGGVGR